MAAEFTPSSLAELPDVTFAARDLTTDGFGGYFSVSLDDDVSGGTYTLVLNGEETEPIDWDADDEDILAALNALPSVDGVLTLD